MRRARQNGPVVWPLLAATVALAGCDSKARSNATAEKKDSKLLRLSPKAVQNADLGFAKAGPATLTRVADVHGEVKRNATRVVKIVPRVAGVVKALKVKQGSQVKQGDLLVLLESRDLAQLKLGYLEAAHGWNRTKRIWEREKRLYQEKVSTKDEYLARRNAFRSASVSLRLAAQRLRLVGLAPEEIWGLGTQAPAKLLHYRVTAPVTGTVTRLQVSEGSSVAADKEILELVDYRTVWGELKVPVRLVGGLRKGGQVDVVCRELGIKHQGRIDFVSPTVDRVSRTVLVRLSIPNTDGRWRPGLAFLARMAGRPTKAAVTVPRAALQEVDGRQAVFVRRGASIFELRFVTVGAKDDRRVAVTKGIEAGETVVTTNSFALKAHYGNQG